MEREWISSKEHSGSIRDAWSLRPRSVSFLRLRPQRWQQRQQQLEQRALLLQRQQHAGRQQQRVPPHQSRGCL